MPNGDGFPLNLTADGQRKDQLIEVVCEARGKLHDKMLARLASASDHSLNDTKPMQHLILYSTSHCSLCDQALELLFSMPGLAGVQLEVVDVADDDNLLSRYGENIPVLRIGERELPAPFGPEELACFLMG